MENGPLEDVFPIKYGEIPASYVIVYQRVKGNFIEANHQFSGGKPSC